LSIWYDRWSGLSTDYIHVAYVDSGADDVLYRRIDAGSSDTLLAQGTVIALASTAAPGPALSITRARGGNLGVAYNIDAAAEQGFALSTTAGSTWGTVASPMEASTDQIALLPGWGADNQDMIGIFWDASANEISRKVFDNSATSWAETNIATAMLDTVASSSFPHFACAVDLAGSCNVMTAWSVVDTFGADLRFWKVTEGTIEEKTYVVLNSTDDQGLAEISIDNSTNGYTVFYCGASDGSETWGTAVKIYGKTSSDGGVTWGPETLYSGGSASKTLWLSSVQRIYSYPTPLAYYVDSAAGNDRIMVSIEATDPKSSYQLGV
jgi:hypothetical protein